MRTKTLAVAAAAMLVAAGSRAQGLDAAAPASVEAVLQARPQVPQPAAPAVLLPQREPAFSVKPQALAGIEPVRRTYLENLADPPTMPRNPAAFGRYVTDPRLLAGVQLTPFLAIEAGYVNLYDRGTHFFDFAYASAVDNTLSEEGFHTHAAARLTLPMGQRFEAYGKLGLAHSELRDPDLPSTAPTQTDNGAYVGAGARYKVSDKASVTGSFERYGNSARWGDNSNNNSLKAKVNLGF